MNKERALREKLKHIETLKAEIEIIKMFEIGRLYSCTIPVGGEDLRYWVVCETFNKDSVRFCVVATDSIRYDQRSWRRDRRVNVESFEYTPWFRDNLHRATKKDLALMVGCHKVFPEAEDIISGKSKVKIDA